MSPRPAHRFAIVMAVALAAAGLGAGAASPAQAATSPGRSDPAVTVTAPTQVTVGEAITLSGTGWTDVAGTAGSVIGIKLDDGAVTTATDVTNPVDGSVLANRTIWAVVRAGSDGSWTASVPFPTPATSASSTTWSAGETHSVRLLTGSLVANDRVRSESASFAVVAAAPTACADGELLVSDTADGQSATACVQREVSTAGGSVIALSGRGWLTRDGAAGATVVLKLTSRTSPTAGDFSFVHTGGAGDAVLTHPTNGTPDPTMWVLVRSDATGSFRITVPVPTAANVPANAGAAGALAAGDKLVVHLQTGVLDADTVHSVDSAPLTVDGVAYSGDEDGEVVACVATGSAQAHLEYPAGQSPDAATGPLVEAGGVVRLVGTGWCASDPSDGGSEIAVKLDDGYYRHRGDEIVSANPQVWQIVDVDSADGSFAVDIRVPRAGDVAGGAVPAFANGTHTLRLLTGSLNGGADPVRTLQVGPFTVGAYQPGGAPDPVDAATLTEANAHGVTAALTGASLVVTVPGAGEGDWIFVTPFAEDGSPRYPWLGTWWRADAQGRVTLPTDGVALPTGSIRVVAQSGEPGAVGELLGWARVTVSAPSTPDAADPAPVPAAAAPAPVRSLAAAVAAAQPAAAPTSVPAAPVARIGELTAANAGRVTASQQGTVVTLAVEGAATGDWVYLYAYTPDPRGVGWIQVDDSGHVRLDIAALPAGDYRVAVLDRAGALLGWTAASVAATGPAETTTSAGGSAAPATGEPTAAAAAPAGLSAADWWLIGAGGAIAAAAASVVIARTGRGRATSGGAA